MNYGLNLQSIPIYLKSSFRYFEEHEKHINRIREDDVLLMVFDGVLKFHEDGHPVEVRAGEYYIQEKRLCQEGVEESECPQYYYIHFLGEFQKGEQVLPLRGKVDFRKLFSMFMKLDMQKMAEAPLMDRECVFLQILDSLRCREQKHEDSQIVQTILESVAKDIRHSFSLDEIADKVGYCKNYIIEVFKEEMGETPYAFVMRMRLEKACELLQYSAAPVGQIAMECGFGSYVNFYRVFYKRYQCSPKEWRKNLQSEGFL